MDYGQIGMAEVPDRRRAGPPTWPLDCLALLAIAAALRFFLLGRTSLWADEIFSVHWSSLDLSFLLGEGARLETNPPTYYVLLKGWIDLFGSSTFAVRALSALAATLTVPVNYGIGRRLRGRGFGLLAGLFLAVDPFMLGLARQARGYPLLALMASLALLGLVEALRRGAPRRLPFVGLFTLGAIGAVLFHYTAVFFIAACFFGVATQMLLDPALRTRDTLLLWSGAAIVIAAAIAGPLLLAAGMSHSANIAWIEPLSGETIWAYFREIVIGNTRPGAFPALLCIILMAIAGFGVARLRPRDPLFTVAVVIPGAFLVMLLAVSLSRPLFISRTGAWLATPLCLLLAAAVLGVKFRWARWVGTVVVLGLLGSFASRVPVRPAIEDWRGVAHLVATDPRCNGPIVTFGPHLLDAEYYDPALASRPAYWVRLVRDQPETSEAVLQRRFSDPTPLNPDELVPFLDAHPGAALMLRFGLQKVWEPVLASTVDRMHLTAEMPGIRVYCR